MATLNILNKLRKYYTQSMYYTYILKSLKTVGAIYIGSTDNLKKRLLEHNSGKSIYSNKHKPWQLETYLVFSDRATAKDFEKYLKSNSGKAFMLKRLVGNEFSMNRQYYRNGRGKSLH